MGLIKAGLGALGGTLADQWKEYFYCEAMDKDTMVVKGRKRTSSRSSNTKGNDNIISNGSVIAVADGQCMMIVEQGQIVESVPNPENLHMTPLRNPASSPDLWVIASWRPSAQWASALPLAVTPERISGCIISTPRS